MQLFTEQQLAVVSDFLQQGHLLAYPTEAVWGIGCDPFNQQAVARVLAIKHRPIEKGMIVVTADECYIQAFLQPLAKDTQQQISQSWRAGGNQATTWLLPIPHALQDKIPSWITGGRDTLAIRVIRHPLVAALCETLANIDHNNPFGFLVSTSCNPSGLLPATTLDEATQYFTDRIGYLQGETLGFSEPSQIKDALTGAIVRN